MDCIQELAHLEVQEVLVEPVALVVLAVQEVQGQQEVLVQQVSLVVQEAPEALVELVVLEALD